MALPVTEDFTGSSGGLSDPPWDSSGFYHCSYDGSGLLRADQPTFDCIGIWNADAPPDDQRSSIEFAFDPSGGGGEYLGIVVRGEKTGDHLDHGYVAMSNGATDTYLWAVVGETFTTIAHDTTEVFLEGDTIGLSASGTTIEVTHNDAVFISVTDSDVASGSFGCAIYTESDIARGDNWRGELTPGVGVHIVGGRGNFIIDSPAWLSILIEDRPPHLTSGMAEPPNWYHVAMVSWGTENGVMTAHPVTRDLELIQLPAGMTILYYELAYGAQATIVELAAP